MPAHNLGPPESEVPAPKEPAPTTTHQVDNANDNRCDRQDLHDAHRASHVDTCDWCRGDEPRQVEHVAVQLRRRRLASLRSPRLHDGRRDPISRSRW